MAVKTEQGCYTEHLERVHKFDHEKSHQKGTGDHGHYHPGAGDNRSDKTGASHHGQVEKHDNYTPENGGYLHDHSHPHKHEGDSLTVLDVETNEFAVAEHVSLDSYNEFAVAENACCYQDAAFSEMGDFSDVSLG